MAVTPINPAIAKGFSLSSRDDTTLIGRLATGDNHAFESLVADHQARLLRLAQRLLGWDPGAEDVVQDVFLSALRNARSFRADSSVGTWLTAITLNACRAHRRRRILRLAWLASLLRTPRPPQERSDAPVLRDETAERVRQAVRQLAPADREVVVLYHLEELPVSEIARILNVSAGAVDVRLHRARARLRHTLAGLIEE